MHSGVARNVISQLVEYVVRCLQNRRRLVIDASSAHSHHATSVAEGGRKTANIGYRNYLYGRILNVRRHRVSQCFT